jgi:hypothetical protein
MLVKQPHALLGEAVERKRESGREGNEDGLHGLNREGDILFVCFVDYAMSGD